MLFLAFNVDADDDVWPFGCLEEDNGAEAVEGFSGDMGLSALSVDVEVILSYCCQLASLEEGSVGQKNVARMEYLDMLERGG